ncbi:hypothetical protein D9619_002382 [Psilocybe cf. subviscida]|uniref:Uncharacterized protein n=1 Tax=Psilocybe cf. subviscida TaxID=2480587 RepID=A0A8H5AXS4_9AGAR|nr:hypothetical protein D9619_002382 [Psilocybe cf. subviscida]
MLAARAAGNILDITVALAPIPYLDISLSIFKVLYGSIQHVRGIRAQMKALATTAADLLYNLHIKLQGMQHLDESIQRALHDFNSLLADICETAERFSKRSYLKIFFTPTDIQKLINQHHQQISQTHLQVVIHNDIRKFEEARKEDHRELLGAIHAMKKDETQLVQATCEAMKDDVPLTVQDVKEYFRTVEVSADERELEQDVVRMLRSLNRSTAFVAPQYPGSLSTGGPPQQYSPTHPPNYPFFEEPVPMAQDESQMPLDPSYPSRRPVYPPVNSGYSSYEAPTGPPSPYVPRYWNTGGNDIQCAWTWHHANADPTPLYYDGLGVRVIVAGHLMTLAGR